MYFICEDFIQLKGYRNHPSIEEEKKANRKKPDSGESGTRGWKDEPDVDGSIANDRERASVSPHRIEQSGVQHGSVCVLDEVKKERETTQTTERSNRREKEAKSGQMKADDSGLERIAGPSEVHFQKHLVS